MQRHTARYLLAIAVLAVGCCEQTLPTIPPDPAEERIFYSRVSGSLFSIISTTSAAAAHQTVMTGKGYLTSTPHHYRLVAIHPAIAGGAIYGSTVVTATTSARQQMEFAPAAERPITCALSSDGTAIAYTTMEGSLYTSRLDGSDRIRLATSVFPFIQPAFSRDNARIAFVGSTPPGHTLYAVNTDGTGQLALAANADTAMRSSIDWTPNNTSLLFAGLDAAGAVQIFIVNSWGNNLQPLTTSPAPKADPVWSPNGYRIAFSQVTGPGGSHDIFMCNPDGSAMMNLTASGESERYPHWSPEGTRLLLTAGEPPLATLRLIDTAGQTTTTVAADVYGRGFWDYSGK